VVHFLVCLCPIFLCFTHPTTSIRHFSLELLIWEYLQRLVSARIEANIVSQLKIMYLRWHVVRKALHGDPCGDRSMVDHHEMMRVPSFLLWTSPRFPGFAMSECL
jgi:hypothetical protein